MPKTSLRRLLWAVAFSSPLLLSACTTDQAKEEAAEAQPVTTAPPPEAAPEPEVSRIPDDGRSRVGLLLPLSGRAAPAGNALLNAAQMALFNHADDKLILVIRDTGGTALGAQVAAQEVIDAGAELIIGPLFASSVEAVRPLAAAEDIPVVAFSNDTQVAGDGVFLLGITPASEVNRVMDYAGRQGLRSYGILAPRTAYGDAVIAAAQEAVARQGGEITKLITYDPQSQEVEIEVQELADYKERAEDLKEQREALEAQGDEVAEQALKRLETLDTLGPPAFEAVLLPAGGNELLRVAPLLPYYDVDPGEVRYLGTRLWDDPGFGREPALQGGWFAAPPRATWKAFRKRYLASYGEEPPRISSLGYDATALAAVLLRETAGQEAAEAYAQEKLTRPQGFAGVDGIFRFTQAGIAERGLAVMELQYNDVQEREAAPATFQLLTN
ncbi:penicillin-binding protein activator [Rhodovibrionaceae bacterium A322]